MEDDNLEQAFRAAFVEPYASRQWASMRAKSYWVDLEGWQDSIAGPVSSIVQNGGCEYVYQRTDWGFAGVDDPESLKRFLLGKHSGLSSAVEQFEPASDAESADCVYMRAQIGAMRSVIERATEIESRRWRMAHSD